MNRRQPATVLLLDSREDARAVYADALRTIGLTVADLDEQQRTIDGVLAINPRVIAVGDDAATRDASLNFCRALKTDSRTERIPVLLLECGDGTSPDLALATHLGVLVLNVPRQDGTKLVAAVSGVLAAQRAGPLEAPLLRRQAETGRP